MTDRRAAYLCICALLLLAPALAQEGPFVPCANCDSRTQSTLPVSGPWANTDQTGSGLLLEIQNGILAGFYFGYDAEGRPEWLLFNGPLAAGESGSKVQWQIEATLSRFSGGSCPSCEFSAPESQETVGNIKLQFFQRNHATFQVDSNPEQFMVPLLYGSAGHQRFSEHTRYLVPELGSDGEQAGGWLISLYRGSPPDRNVFSSVLVHFEASVVTFSQETGRNVEYSAVEKISLVDADAPALRINCSDASGSGEIQCQIHVAIGNYVDVFYMPIANLGASRFFAESEEGYAVEGFRLGYE